jgi:hypothetical protein
MKIKILILLGIFTSAGAIAQIRENNELNLTKFNLTDLGFHENIKCIKTSFCKKNENGDFLPSGWRTVLIYHHFDEQGKLISEYGIDQNSDTCKITLYTYTKNNLIEEVKQYEKGYNGIYSTKDLRNWDFESAKFEYDNRGNKLKMILKKLFSNATIIYSYNQNNQLTKELILDNTSETNSSLNKTEYFYTNKSELTKKVKLNINNPYESGETIYSYNEDGLSSEIFSGFDGTTVNKVYYSKNNINSYSRSDTLKNYDKKTYNQKGELEKSEHHYDGDGEFKHTAIYSYTYDSKNNLTEEMTVIKYEILNSQPSKYEEISKVIYEISYY